MEVIDDFVNWLDPEHVIVRLNEMKTLRFDVRHAGPGQFVKGHLKVNEWMHTWMDTCMDAWMLRLVNMNGWVHGG